MLLVLNIGNTNVRVGAFDGPGLLHDWRLETDVRRTGDEYGLMLSGMLSHAGLVEAQIEGVAMGSVVPPLTDTFTRVSRRYLKQEPLILSPNVKTGVAIKTDNPAEVGADRILNVLAAHRLHGGPAIVIDIGTATTFDVLSGAGEYLGGAIAPGINLSAEALFRGTAQLPRIGLHMPASPIGKNTVTAMQAGLLLGCVAMIEGMTARIKAELGGQALVIATGGLGRMIAAETKVVDVLEPDLTLQGLRLLWEQNRAP